MQFSPNGYSYNGQVFRDIEEYAKYILKCKEDDRIKAEKEKQDKLKADKARRTEELDKAYVEYFETCKSAKEKFENIRKKYNEDYSYEFNPKYIYFNDFFDNIDKLFRL